MNNQSLIDYFEFFYYLFYPCFEVDFPKWRFSLFGNVVHKGISPQSLVREKYAHALTKYACPAMSLNPSSSDDVGSATVTTLSIAPLHLAMAAYKPLQVFWESMS